MTAPITRATFYAQAQAEAQASGLPSQTISDVEFTGLHGNLDAWEQQGWSADLRHVAYTMATARHACRLNFAIREVARGASKSYGVAVAIDGQVYQGRSACQLTWLGQRQDVRPAARHRPCRQSGPRPGAGNVRWKARRGHSLVKASSAR